VKRRGTGAPRPWTLFRCNGQSKTAPGLRSGAALECPTGLGAKKDRALHIKIKIRVLIRESWCPNLDSPTQAGGLARADLSPLA
jgi:hypothetical protein